MTQQQATEIRNHLVNELMRNGFNDVVRQIAVRAQESVDVNKPLNNDVRRLSFYVDELISILENLSNNSYGEPIARINEFTSGSNRITASLVELDNHLVFDLKDLPDYSALIAEFKQIQKQLEKENNRDNNRGF